MLTKEFVQESVSISNFFAERGKSITAAPNTALSRLVRSQDEKLRNAVLLGGTDVRGNPNLQPGFEADLAVNLLCNSADQTINEITESNGFMGVHAEVLDQEVQRSKQALLSVFHTARQVVMPQVKRLHEEVQSAMENNIHGRASRFEVVTSGTPNLYTSQSFRDRIAPYAGVGQGQITVFPRYFTTASDEALAEMVKTGMSSIDAEYDEALGGTDALRDLWNAFFVASAHVPNGTPALTMAQIAESPDSDRYFVGLYLLADAVMSNRIPEGVQYVAQGVDPVRAVSDICTNLRALVGKALFIRSNQAVEAVAGRRLVIRYDDYKVYVNGPVYDEFMQAGGTQEMILGNLLQRGKVYSMDEMLQRGSELEVVWARGVANVMETDRSNGMTIQRRVAAEVFKVMLAEIQEANPQAIVNVNQLTSTFLKTYDGLPELELRDFHIAATKLICRTLYTDPCFEQILMQMFSIKREQPNASMDLVVTLAFVNYIGRWLASQIVTNRRL